MVAKKKTSGSKARPAKALDRAKRVAHGEAVNKAVKKRINDLQLQPRRAGNGMQAVSVAESTEKAYEREAIMTHAYEKGLEEDDVRACVTLTKIIAAISDDEPELEKAVQSGLIMILKSELPKLAKLKSPEIEEWLRGRLEDQV